MIKTLSLCPTCYRKIPASISFIDGMAVMAKECDVHGPFSAIVEKDIQHVSNFYQPGTLGKNNTIIVNMHNTCNMKCSWCYYPMGVEKMHPFEYYHALLGQYRGFSLLFSGGEPTERLDFFEFVAEAYKHGWNPSSITNMINLGDIEFFKKTLTNNFISDGIYKFAMSMQHPKNYSHEILVKKMMALEHIEKAGLKASCVMFSIQSLDELEYIREFYNHTKTCYQMIRIRTMFRNWANKGGGNHIYLSDLHKAVLRTFGDLMPIQSQVAEKSNMYCLYMEMDKGIILSLSCAPTVENIDCHLTGRPAYMLAMDGRCYPVPWAQIINEGISKGWHDGYKLEGGLLCGE